MHAMCSMHRHPLPNSIGSHGLCDYSWSGIPGLDLLSKSLISEHLLLFENLLGEAYFELDDSLLVNDAILRSAIV